jgi:hypothetical protein
MAIPEASQARQGTWLQDPWVPVRRLRSSSVELPHDSSGVCAWLILSCFPSIAIWVLLWSFVDSFLGRLYAVEVIHSITCSVRPGVNIKFS